MSLQGVDGGATLGMLSYKPQLFLLAPVALAGARAWRALAACGLAAALLALASAAVLGIAPWHLWIDRTILARDPSYESWFAETFLRGFSLYVSARLLGLPDWLAKALQLAAACVAAGAVYWTWRSNARQDERLAVLLVATVAATPHLQAYDMVLLGAAVVLLFGRGEGIGVGTLALFGVTWLLPLLRPYNVPNGRLVIPAALAALLAVAARRALPPSRHDLLQATSTRK